jgi:hypothetical protein
MMAGDGSGFARWLAKLEQAIQVRTGIKYDISTLLV